MEIDDVKIDNVCHLLFEHVKANLYFMNVFPHEIEQDKKKKKKISVHFLFSRWTIEFSNLSINVGKKNLNRFTDDEKGVKN